MTNIYSTSLSLTPPINRNVIGVNKRPVKSHACSLAEGNGNISIVLAGTAGICVCVWGEEGEGHMTVIFPFYSIPTADNNNTRLNSSILVAFSMFAILYSIDTSPDFM